MTYVSFFNEAMRSPNLKTSFGFALGSLNRLVQKIEFEPMDQKRAGLGQEAVQLVCGVFRVLKTIPTWILKLGGSFDNTLCTKPKENSTK